MGGEPYNASLRPLADVGTTGITVVKPTRRNTGKRNPDAQAPAMPVAPEDEEQRMTAAGFRFRHGAWRR